MISMLTTGFPLKKGVGLRQQSLFHALLLIGMWLFLILGNQSLGARENQTSSGQLIGQVIDGETGEGLIGANVYLEGTTLGAATDLDGTFHIENVPTGTYTLIVQMIGYTTLRVTGITVSAGDIQKLQLTVRPEALTTEEVVVEARLVLDNEAALLKERQNHVAVSDAISAEEFSRISSSNAAEAMRALTGASVMEGKYILVRGLGERYSSTQLNGVELPTSDPDKRAFQFDLLPAALLNNIMTLKTFTPDKPGNFSGGLVDIATKVYPESFTLTFSSSAAYHSETTFNSNFISSNSGGWDWLGMDDGTRGLPPILQQEKNIPSEITARTDPQSAQKLNQISRAFSPVMSPITRQAPLNQSYTLTIGNKGKLLGRTFGYMASLSYKNTARYYEDGKVGRWKLTGKVAENDSLTNLIDLTDRQGTQQILLGGLGMLSYKLSPRHEISINTLFTQSGEDKARYLIGRWPEQFLNNPNTYFETRALHYTQRTLQTYQFRGEHAFSQLKNLKINWHFSYGTTLQKEPDVRFFSDNFALRKFQGRDTVIYSISPSIYQRPGRYFRNLKENNQVLDVKLELPLQQRQQLSAKLMIGGYYMQKNRTFRERLFEYHQGSTLRYLGDPQTFFAPQNTGIIGYDSLRNRTIFGNYIQESLNALGGNYDGEETITAGFLMLNLPLFRTFRVIGGVRYETTKMTVSDEDTSGYLNDKDWLPSLNLIYNFSKNMNMRFAFGRTLARPNFREKAPYASYQFMNDVIFQGNVQLKRTLIDNYDIRWEWFPQPGEVIALSGFYKYFRNPIERVINLLYASEGAIVKYENVDRAQVYGLEAEIRKHLGSIHPILTNWSLNANVSIIHSRVNIPGDELRLIRALNPSASATRPLQGQSPYILNMELTYHSPESGTQATLYYNVFGERLAEVSLGGTPNAFEQPRPMLDFTFSQQLAHGVTLTASVNNLFNQNFKIVHHYKGYDYVRQSYRLGRTISIGFKYKL